ncbi:MAG: hypothetical protein Q7S89_00265 [bacterium]|nr:hypothetical protein [bacterium]
MQKLVEMKHAKFLLIAVVLSIVGTVLVLGEGRDTKADEGKLKIVGTLEVVHTHYNG